MIDSGRLFPHKVFGDLGLRASDVTLSFSSGRRVSVTARPAVSTQPNEYHLFADDDLSGWSLLHVSLRVVAQVDVIQGLLPEGSRLEDNAVMVVGANCVSTRLRRRVFLTRDPDREGEWYGQLDVAVDDLHDSIELSPILARTTRFPESATDEDGVALAAYPGAILAFGEPIRLRVDAPKDERGGSFKVTWESFSTSLDPWRRDHPGDIFFIDTAEEAPQVFLNGDHDLLKQTLMKKRPRGPEATIKASVIAYIAHTTWVTLFLAAIADSVESEEGGPEWPSDPVKVKVLRRLLPLLMSDRTDDEARLEEAVAQYKDPSSFSALLTKLHSTIQGLIRIDDFVVKTLESAAIDEEA